MAANRDPALWEVRIPLRLLPGQTLMADLRESVFVQFLRNGCFPHQVGEDRLFLHLVRPGDVVYDVGANIGYTPLLFAHAASPGGRVLAFEPSPRSFRFLQGSIQENAAIEAINIALSDHEGTMDFFEAESLETSSLVPVQGISPIPVPIRTLDQFATGRDEPTFIKVDVEGHEPAVFRGMAHTLERQHPPVVVFEALSSEALDCVLSTFHPLIRCPWHVFRMTHAGSLLSPSSKVGTNNYLAIPECHLGRLEGLACHSPMVLLPRKPAEKLPQPRRM